MKNLGKIILAAALVAVLGLAPIILGVNVAAEPLEDYQIDSDGTYIAVEGTAKRYVKPAYALANIAVRSEAASAKEASEQCAEIVAEVMAALEAQGIDEADYQTAYFSVYDKMDYNASPPEVYAYEVYNQLEVKVRELEKLGDVLAAALDAGANDIDNLSYELDAKGEAYQEALAEAYSKAATKADILAKVQGVKLQAIPVSIEEIPQTSYSDSFIWENSKVKDEAAGVGTVPIAPQAVELTANVQVIFALEKEGVEEQKTTQIRVNAHSTVSAPADFARVNLAVEEQGATAAEAAQANNASMEKIFKLLEEKGIDKKDFETRNFRVSSIYDYNAEPPIVAGYEVVNDLLVTIRDLDQLSELITAVLDAGANRLNNLVYRVNDEETPYNSCLEEAGQVVSEKVEVLREAAGLQGEATLTQLAEDSLSFYGPLGTPANTPRDFDMLYGCMEAAGMPMSSGDVEISARIEALYIVE